ncbi:MAG: hypothetical protein CM1200mP41_30540 [Gammaproteobacteria bacterium]|nr:MAG: hypothetical protein CM1200mP41_30540 [Gammaproteobacteria bacterium]
MEVKTALFHAENVDHLRIKVVTERAHVYLMGLVSPRKLTRQPGRPLDNGVARVGLKGFEYL